MGERGRGKSRDREKAMRWERGRNPGSDYMISLSKPPSSLTPVPRFGQEIPIYAVKV